MSFCIASTSGGLDATAEATTGEIQGWLVQDAKDFCIISNAASAVLANQFFSAAETKSTVLKLALYEGCVVI